MRTPIWTVLVCLMVVGALAQDTPVKDAEVERIQWGPTAGGCRLSLGGAAKEYRCLEPISLSVILENTGKTAVHVVLTGWIIKDYRISVRLPDGKPAPLTLEGRRQANAESSGARLREIAPGKRYAVTIPALNCLYDMTLEGEYKISVERAISLDGGRTKMQTVSNVLSITVRDLEIEDATTKPEE